MCETDILWYEELERHTGKSDNTGRSRCYKSDLDKRFVHTDMYGRNINRNHNSRKRKRKKRRIRLFCIVIVLAVLFVSISRGSAIARNIILRASGCPESLIELAERQPEAYDFAREYKKYADKDIAIDISNEVKEGKIPLFIQWDKRWGYRDYGGNYMALNGCGPTCLSMVYCGIKGDTEWNPYKVAQWSDEHGYYVPGSGTAWSLMGEGAAQLGLQVMEANPDADTITEELARGKVIIACMGPGDFTTQGHFIVLTRVTGSGKIVINDPNSKKRSKQTWDVDRLVAQMKDMWVYQ